MINPRQIHPSVDLTQLGHLLKHILSLLQLTLLATLFSTFEEESNAVIVPSLPAVLDGRWLIFNLFATFKRQFQLILGHDHHGQRATLVFALAPDEVHILAVELAIVQLGFKLDRALQISRHFQLKVDNLASPWRNLLVIERNEDILRVSPIDPVAFTIKHVNVDEMGQRVDCSLIVDPTRLPNQTVSLAGCQFDPDFVGVNGSLGQRVANSSGPDHDFHQILLTGLEARSFWPERRDQR